MSNVLKPVAEFDSTGLGIELNHLVRDNIVHGMLYDRHFLGTMKRYGGDVHDAIASAEKLKSKPVERTLAAFVVVNASGDVAGMATFYPGLQLRKLRVPLAPKLAKGPLAKEYSNIGWNVSAWTNEAHIDQVERPLLQQAYADLLMVDQLAGESGHFTGARWTLETEDGKNGHHMLDILSQVGFKATDFARFDDQESQLQVPPMSYLLIAPQKTG